MSAGVRLQGCLNGARAAAEHPALPVTPEALAAAAAEAVAAGAQGVHLHPRDAGGRDSVAAEDVAAAVTAVHAAVDVEVGVTTGAWVAPDPDARRAAVAGWTARPDVASVNWHEPGSPALAVQLDRAGVGVEAGLWTTAAAVDFLGSPMRHRARRVLVEATPDDAEAALAAAASIVALLVRAGVRVPLLVHGEGAGAWPVLRWAAARGHAVRIGLEDSLLLPDGSTAGSSAEQVRAAAALLR
jgi:uncharacterized protein (DUF849 family)